MSDENNPGPEKDPEVWVTVLGNKIRLILPGEGWSFKEALLAKQVSDGLAPVEVEARMMVGDPHAWLAVLRVSLSRAGLRADAERLGEMDVLDLAEQVYQQVREATKDLPPSNASPSSEPESSGQPESGSGEAPSSETTPDHGGTPA